MLVPTEKWKYIIIKAEGEITGGGYLCGGSGWVGHIIVYSCSQQLVVFFMSGQVGSVGQLLIFAFYYFITLD